MIVLNFIIYIFTVLKSYFQKGLYFKNLLIEKTMEPLVMPKNEYFDFKEMKPRNPLHLKRDSRFIPKTETMQQLCIVTAADRKYFSLLTEFIESIKATRYYKDIDICIVDCGLTSKQKIDLKQRWGITNIKDPGWDVKVKKGTPKHVKSITVRPYIAKHFPGYRYYLWIDSDAWIQDERVLDRFVHLCQKQGWAFCSSNFPNWAFLTLQTLPYKDWFKIAFKNKLQGGVFCFDVNSPYPQLWASYMEEVVEKRGFHYMTEEDAANFIYYQENLRFLNRHENYVVLRFGNPVLRKGDDTFYDPWTNEPIGIVHLALHKVARHITNPVYYFPTRFIRRRLCAFQAYYHWFLSSFWHKFKPGYISTKLMPRRTFVSLRFRVFKEEEED